jgi:hypothetical protein
MTFLIQEEYPTLKEFCKHNGYTFRQRRQGNRYYVTVAFKEPEKIVDWLFKYRTLVHTYYPRAYMTSGSVYGATFMIGDIIEALKGKT